MSLSPPSGIIRATCPLADVLWMTNSGRSCCTMRKASEIVLGQGKVGAFCNSLVTDIHQHVSFCGLSLATVCLSG